MSDEADDTAKQYRESLQKMLFEHVLEIADKHGSAYGSESSQTLIISLITSLMSSLVYIGLKHSADKRRMPEYRVMKNVIQNAVSAAFISGHRAFKDPLPVEFVCTIERIGPSPSKVSN